MVGPELAGAVERGPGGAAIGGAEHSNQRPAHAEQTAEAAGPGDQGLTCAVRRIKRQGADRQRALRIGQRHPGRPRIPGVSGPPYAPIDRTHVHDIWVRQMGGNRLDGTHDLLVRDAFDLPARGRPGSLRCPDKGHVLTPYRLLTPPVTRPAPLVGEGAKCEITRSGLRLTIE